MARNLILLLLTIILGAGITYGLDYAGIMHSAALQPLESTTSKAKTPTRAAKNKTVPNFTFKILEGDVLSIKDLRGKIVVLNFWASWCAPCVKEFPHFLKLAKEYPDHVVFLALSSDHKPEDMNRFLSKMAYQHPAEMDLENVKIALDEKGAITRDIFQTYRLPETIIIGPKGKMRHKLIGADWDYEFLEQIIAKI